MCDCFRLATEALYIKEKYPGEAFGPFLMGELLMEQNKFQEAEAEYFEAFSLQPLKEFEECIFTAQMKQLMNEKFSAHKARSALIFTKSVEVRFSDRVQCMKVQASTSSIKLILNCFPRWPEVFYKTGKLHLNYRPKQARLLSLMKKQST